MANGLCDGGVVRLGMQVGGAQQAGSNGDRK